MTAASLTLLLDFLGADAARWVAAFGRVLPVSLIVPAFGVRFLPWPVRLAIGFALMLGVVPGVEPSGEGSLLRAFLGGVLRGVPVALAASVALWAAAMAGGLSGELAFGRGALRRSPLETWFGLFAAAAFFVAGGPARIVAALAGASTGPVLSSAAADVVAGIGIAVAIAGPLLVVAILADVGGAFFTRGVAALEPLAASFRSFLVLGAAAVFFERTAELIVLLQR